jgi:hypothetical protein
MNSTHKECKHWNTQVAMLAAHTSLASSLQLKQDHHLAAPTPGTCRRLYASHGSPVGPDMMASSIASTICCFWVAIPVALFEYSRAAFFLYFFSAWNTTTRPLLKWCREDEQATIRPISNKKQWTNYVHLQQQSRLILNVTTQNGLAQQIKATLEFLSTACT